MCVLSKRRTVVNGIAVRKSYAYLTVNVETNMQMRLIVHGHNEPRMQNKRHAIEIMNCIITRFRNCVPPHPCDTVANLFTSAMYVRIKYTFWGIDTMYMSYNSTYPHLTSHYIPYLPYHFSFPLKTIMQMPHIFNSF